MSIGYFTPSVNLFGVGCSAEIGEQAKLIGGEKAFIVTDAFLAKSGIVDKIVGHLAASGIKSFVYAGAEPNPTDKNVHNGLELWNKEGCNFFVSIGGGSSHDCAKGINFVASCGGHITAYEGVGKATKNLFPLLAVTTTSGTASEMTLFCVITDTARNVKMPIGDPRCTAKVSFNDPELMVGMPPALTAATGMDAMTHAVEAYVSKGAYPLSDAAALMGIRLIAKYLPKAVADGSDLVAREQMAYAQYLGGMAFNNAVLGYVHAMAHQLGSNYNLPHGVCNAVLLPVVSQFNLIARAERYRDIAIELGCNVKDLTVVEAAQAAVDAMKSLNASIGIPPGIKNFAGVKESDFEHLAKYAMLDVCAAFNPRVATLEEVVQLYKNAMV